MDKSRILSKLANDSWGADRELDAIKDASLRNFLLRARETAFLQTELESRIKEQKLLLFSGSENGNGVRFLMDVLSGARPHESLQEQLVYANRCTCSYRGPFESKWLSDSLSRCLRARGVNMKKLLNTWKKEEEVKRGKTGNTGAPHEDPSGRLVLPECIRLSEIIDVALRCTIDTSETEKE